MGDRALIRFHNGQEIGPVVYLHWGGSGVGSLLRDVKERMQGREGDVKYTTARCIGLAHERIDGNLSLGVWSEASEYKPERERMLEWDPNLMDYPASHGDAGVFLVNCRTWETECFGGYGLTNRKDGWSGPPVMVQL